MQQAVDQVEEVRAVGGEGGGDDFPGERGEAGVVAGFGVVFADGSIKRARVATSSRKPSLLPATSCIRFASSRSDGPWTSVGRCY
jgi:hypothetical protein